MLRRLRRCLSLLLGLLIATVVVSARGAWAGDLASPADAPVLAPDGGLCEPCRPLYESDCECLAGAWPAFGADPFVPLFRQDRAFAVRGWLDAGILGNTSSPASRFNGPYNAVQRDDGQFNQAYIIMERALAADGSLSLGGRIDLLYGSDYYLAQSNGFERTRSGNPHWNSSPNIGLALPQAYGEIGTNDASVKAGHFYSIVGYEGVQSTGNFFYSHAYSYQFAGPFTHWGLQATRKLNDRWQWQAGLINGWNNLDSTVNHGAFIGSLKYTDDERGWWSSFAIVTGTEQNNPANLPTVVNGYANLTRYSFLVNKQIGRRVEYVFHQWAGIQQTGAPGGGPAKWYGLDQYLYYRLNERWRLGTRVEWFRDQAGTRVGLTEPNNPNQAPLPGSYGSWTIGANWLPRANVLIRPELRWDSYAGPARPYDDGTKTSQLLLGFDSILQF